MVFPFWSVGVDVAEFNLLAKATDEKIESLTGSAKPPDFAVLNKQFPNCSNIYSVRDRMLKSSKPGGLEEHKRFKK